MNLRQKAGAFALALVAALAVAFVAASPAQAWPASGYYKIKLYGYDRCLDVRGVNPNDGALIQTYSCISGQANQRFYLQSNGAGGNTYQIKTWVGKCLDVQGASTSIGANIQQYACLGWSQTNQIFSPNVNTSPTTWLTFAACINAANWNNGADVIQDVCSNNLRNNWELIPA